KIKTELKVPIPEGAKGGVVTQFPEFQSFILRLNYYLQSKGVTINTSNPNAPSLIKMAISFIEIIDESKDFISITRFENMLSMHANQMADLLFQDPGFQMRMTFNQLESTIDKALFYFFAQRMKLESIEIKPTLERTDFYYFS